MVFSEPKTTIAASPPSRPRRTSIVGRPAASSSGLFARDADGLVAAEGTHTPDDDEVAARLEALAGRAPGKVAVERVETPAETRWAGEPRQPVELATAIFERTLDARWRRVSYSGIVSVAREEPVATEPELDVIDDELLPTAATTDVAPSTDAEEQRLRAAPAALAAMPGGADVGDLLHRVLDATDFASPDLGAELAARLAEQRRRRDVDIGDTEAALGGRSRLRWGL